MHLKASPRKGLSKNNEEILALKSRKCLFVPKPKGSAEILGSDAINSHPIEAHGDKEKDTGPHSEFADTCIDSSNPLSVSCSVVNVDEVVNGGDPIINHNAELEKDGGILCPTLNETTACVDVVGSLTKTPFCLSFEIGCSNPPAKKLLKLKKRRMGKVLKLVETSVGRGFGLNHRISLTTRAKERYGIWIL